MNKIILFLFFPLIILSQEATLMGDVDCNGQVNSEDASLILQYVTSIIDSLPCSNNMTGLTPSQLEEIIDMLSISNINNDNISMFGPMYRYVECDESCLSVDYLFGAQQSNQLYYFEALAFCSQLEYEGYDDWRLPSLRGLHEWVSTNNNNVLPIPNFPDDGTGYGMFFLEIKDDVYTNGNPRINISNNANMLYLDNGGSGKCFCVR